MKTMLTLEVKSACGGYVRGCFLLVPSSDVDTIISVEARLLVVYEKSVSSKK